jgi:glycosyltransferase involved in cell wall biosynthesis
MKRRDFATKASFETASMAYQGKKIAVVMPAYNAEKTVAACCEAIPKDLVDDVILVDDGSSDDTVAVARRLPIHVHVHERNRGYGGNQKTCYRLARARGADIAVMVHPDHQYDPRFVTALVETMARSGAKAVFGSRMMVKCDALKGGMPLWKFAANIALTRIGNLVLGTRLTEFHSGMRAYDLGVFDRIDIERNSDDFVFDTQIIIQLVDKKIPIAEVPISTRYFPEASQISFRRSCTYGFGILKNLFLYKTGLRKF